MRNPRIDRFDLTLLEMPRFPFALCREEDPEKFHPVGTTGPALTEIEAAKAVCRMCVHQTACREWALEKGETSGVWGGLSEEDRVKEKRREQRIAARVRGQVAA